MKTAIGIDVGGTNIKICAVDERGKLLREMSLPTRSDEGPEGLVSRSSEVIAAWKEHRAAPVGLGLAGDVDQARGTLRFTPNLRGWAGFPFKKALAKKLRRRVLVENDANCAVWGGYVAELKRKPRHVVGVTLGTGVGGGLIIEGRLYRGATGSAAELGHTTVVDGGEPCNCGGLGHVEAYVGNYGIVRTARRLIGKDPAGGRALQELCPDMDLLTPKHLTEAAERGDAVARRVWQQTGRILSMGLANFILTLNPDAVLLLGGVSQAGRWLLDPVQEGLSKQPFRTPFAAAAVRMAANPNAGCVGAALLALEDGR